MRKKKYSPKFKFTVVVESLKSDGTDAEVARQHGVHPVTLASWKRQFMENGHAAFAGRESEVAYEKKIQQLERMLGQKEVELALLRNFTPRS